MVCFPYTLLIGQFWKVPKKWDKSPVLYLHVVCFLPTGHSREPGPSAGKLLARAACVVGSTSRPPAEATPLPYQALESLFSGLSLSPAWTTYSNGGVQLNTTYISSPIPVSLLVFRPAAWNAEFLSQTVKPARLLMRLDAVNLRAERGILGGTLALGIHEAFLCRASEVVL